MSTSRATREASHTIDIPTFAGWLGISVSAAYELAHRDGEIAGVPIIRVGARRYLSRAACEAVVGGQPVARPTVQPEPAVEPPLSPADLACLVRAYRFLEEIAARQSAAEARDIVIQP